MRNKNDAIAVLQHVAVWLRGYAHGSQNHEASDMARELSRVEEWSERPPAE